jgi:hypothetical protein
LQLQILLVVIMSALIFSIIVNSSCHSLSVDPSTFMLNTDGIYH